MSSCTSPPADSVLEEIRSAIASFESLRTAGTAHPAGSNVTLLANNPLVAVGEPLLMHNSVDTTMNGIDDSVYGSTSPAVTCSRC